ncbi:MAG: TIGR00366 family protein [Candidatus Competibacteraceae bacterium]|nr:TIGR00366 family protein [Candidatus Competibacteraceae bacterium]
MNFFIGSASAKAFLMMPILAPLADMVGITRQTAVLAFDFGDGFSNMLFPTNALLLIGLGFTVVSYPKWLRWTVPLQIGALALSLAFLFIAVKIGFGPF